MARQVNRKVKSANDKNQGHYTQDNETLLATSNTMDVLDESFRK
jgi:hypothetical protein